MSFNNSLLLVSGEDLDFVGNDNVILGDLASVTGSGNYIFGTVLFLKGSFNKVFGDVARVRGSFHRILGNIGEEEPCPYPRDRMDPDAANMAYGLSCVRDHTCLDRIQELRIRNLWPTGIYILNEAREPGAKEEFKATINALLPPSSRDDTEHQRLRSVATHSGVVLPFFPDSPQALPWSATTEAQNKCMIIRGNNQRVEGDNNMILLDPTIERCMVVGKNNYIFGNVNSIVGNRNIVIGCIVGVSGQNNIVLSVSPRGEDLSTIQSGNCQWFNLPPRLMRAIYPIIEQISHRYRYSGTGLEIQYIQEQANQFALKTLVDSELASLLPPSSSSRDDTDRRVARVVYPDNPQEAAQPQIQQLGRQLNELEYWVGAPRVYTPEEQRFGVDSAAPRGRGLGRGFPLFTPEETRASLYGSFSHQPFHPPRPSETRAGIVRSYARDPYGFAVVNRPAPQRNITSLTRDAVNEVFPPIIANAMTINNTDRYGRPVARQETDQETEQKQIVQESKAAENAIELEKCQMCSINKRSACLNPCGHALYCCECITIWRTRNTGRLKCPVCRRIVKSVIRMFT